MDVGVVGMGVVGTATAQLFSHKNTVLTYDTNGTGTCQSLRELGKKVEVAFVCVPTPRGVLNRLDTSAVRQVCRDLEGACVVCVRSTVPVGTCKTLPGQIVYWPEFCNAKTAYVDMATADWLYLGGDLGHVAVVCRAINSAPLCGSVVPTTWENAEAVKLATNAAMAAKIAVANELKAAVTALGADWDAVSRFLAYDERLGDVGWKVPGPDGKPGFGGACLPKDLAGFVAMAADAKVTTEVLATARAANNRIRPEGKT